MARLIDKLLRRLHLWLIRRCRHHGAHVKADLLEGDGRLPVRWCERCGAVKTHPLQPFRIPRPDW